MYGLKSISGTEIDRLFITTETNTGRRSSQVFLSKGSDITKAQEIIHTHNLIFNIFC